MDLERTEDVKEDVATLPGVETGSLEKEEGKPKMPEPLKSTFSFCDRPNKKKLGRVLSIAKRTWVG